MSNYIIEEHVEDFRLHQDFTENRLCRQKHLVDWVFLWPSISWGFVVQNFVVVNYFSKMCSAYKKVIFDWQLEPSYNYHWHYKSLYSFRGVLYDLGRRVRRNGPSTPKIPLFLIMGFLISALWISGIIQNVIRWYVLW